MPATLLRRGLWVLGAGLVAGAVAVLAVPMVASSRIVKDRIATEMSDWTGYRVTIAADPDIRIWPDFQAVLSDVRLSLPGDLDQKPILEAERIDVELSALAALRGEVEFSAARFVRPTLHLRGAASVPLPAGGRLARAIADVRDVVAENRASPDLSRFPDDGFGDVEVIDGRILSGPDDEPEEIATGLTGKASWPTLNGQGWLSVNGVWRGEPVTLDMSSGSPMLLLAGGAAPLAVAVKSAPMSLGFLGAANLMQDPYADGQVSFATPSLRRMLEWSRGGTAPGTASGAVAVQGRVTGNAQRLKIENAEITLDGNAGRGVLDVQLAGPLPAIGGTLAFDTLELGALLSGLSPPDRAPDDGLDAVAGWFADRADMDLRLSAGRATVGPATLTDVAATARVKDGLAAFDISDATVFGGSAQAGMRLNRTPSGTEAELRLLATDVDGGALAGIGGYPRFGAIGRGNLSVILKGPGRDWQHMLTHSTGSISASFGAGSLGGFDLAAFVQRTAKGGFFPLDEVANGTLATTGVELKATVADGVATIEKAELRAARDRIALTGIMPFAGKGLALTGAVLPAAQPTAGTEPAAGTEFFVGGSWDAPFVSPIERRPQDDL